MGSLSDTYEDNVLDALLGQGFTKPDPVYIALFTTSPTDSTFGTEVSGGAYARVELANDNTEWPDASAGSKSNGTEIEFPEATGSWGTVVAWAIMDDETIQDAANIIFWGALGTPKAIGSGETPKFPALSLVVQAD